MSNSQSPKIEKVIIIGGGPAGLTAALYLARAELNPLVLAGPQWGGQLMLTTTVENYPGFPEGIEGPELMLRFRQQAEKFGARIEEKLVQRVDFQTPPFLIATAAEEWRAWSVIVATGAKPRRLGIPGEEKFWGRGVSSCAVCDGAFFKNKVVAVVGGGDSAMEEAHFLSRLAQKVYLIHRRREFRATPIMVERVKKQPKITILYQREVRQILGEEKVEKLILFAKDENKEEELVVDGLFLAVGHEPATELFKGQLEIDERGYLKTFAGTASSQEGIFIAGDATDSRYRQAVTAAAEGCKAALDLRRYLEEKEISR